MALAATKQWHIVLSGRRAEELEKTAQLCREAAGVSGGEDGEEYPLTLSVTGDVGVEDNVKGLFGKIKETYG